MRGAIEFRDVSKVYDASLALAKFSHSFDAGRVHALMGKNGSGKSTAIKILAGAVQPTLGTLFVNGERAIFAAPSDAFAAGIVTVHQELSLVPSLSVGENIFLGRLPKRGVFVDWAKLHHDAGALLAEMKLEIDTRRPVASLSLGQQQMVEIVKAMSSQPAILILDEPTSALASREVGHLFELVRRLKERGVTVIYITHRMNELSEIADTCTVIRDGRYIGTVEMNGSKPGTIIEMMFGDVARAQRPARRLVKRDRPVLSVRGLTRLPDFADVSFDLYPGEVLGMAGLLGAGRTETLRAIFGADSCETGEILIGGQSVQKPSPRRMKDLGLGYTPENRKEVGLVQSASVHDNLILASLRRIASRGLTWRKKESPFVARQVGDLGIKTRDPMLPISTLSGGNQQKVVIGNWLNSDPKVMFFDEPSRGVDVLAKQQIFEIIWRKAQAGVSAVFVSSELEELFDVCDRILVMRQGRVVCEVAPEAISLAQLYQLCMEGA
ncbi:D-ribose transporter ATP binding protein [Mesorhizobium sp. LSJC255A00]|uniref:sugar ABC transporter ATP-binding protein n=1 Tax=unclassified Mesorhizobium TaxID=325217 RepID=UPI0003CF44D3|nr:MULTISPECIES: sugar ABC transporter ATP-binding protein [unclassified Mesorhizobium]ESX20168.1 D-ribose transporter ATP binding protein [Mesorhizobium sp. LSJC255A00]ESX78120.1 D-ribose transporter ATP binding protein [Mesorhizobium sp. LSHC414A00]